jgi:hypothetical protein
MNDSRTNGSICAETVPAARAALILKREAVGADTPTGRTISTLVEQLENKQTYVRPPWANDRRQTLDFQIEKSLARLGG